LDTTPRILFAISDTGGGHRSGALAIKTAIELFVSAQVECHIVDMLTSTGMPLVKDAPELYDDLSTRWLPAFDFIWQLTNGRKRIDALSGLVYLGAHRNILRVLEEVRPTLVVSVHPLVNRFIGHTRRTYRLSFRFVTVVTDLVSLHASWADPDAELCIAPTHEAYERLRLEGMPAHKLARTGFPVHPKFATYNGTQPEARATVGVAAQPFTLLLTSGGVGAGNMGELVEELYSAYPDVQLLVVTGRNTALREQLLARRFGPLVHIYGFVDNMEQLMAASDIVITKAGPGTLMEALVMRRPVIVTQAVGMQERGNIDFVLNHELGAFCPTVDRIVPAVADLMRPETYAATSARLADAVPRDGAEQIARILLDQLRLAPPARTRRLRFPGITTIRQISSGRLRLPRARRPRLPLAPSNLRLPRVRPLMRWRRPRR
jgi:UDP-N-acetylglucosamine:LPS N-acetylglucosamine transferase